MVPWVGLRCVIVVFPDNTHLLFSGFLDIGIYFCCVLNVMSLLSFFDSSRGGLGWSVVCDCGISYFEY